MNCFWDSKNDMVEFLHFLDTEWVQMELEQVVAMLIDPDIKRGIHRMRGECLMVGESQYVIAVTHVVRVDDVGIVGTFVDAFVYFGMGVQAGPFPTDRGVEIRIRIVNPVTGEGLGTGEAVYRRDTECCKSDDDNKQESSQYFEKS